MSEQTKSVFVPMLEAEPPIAGKHRWNRCMVSMVIAGFFLGPSLVLAQDEPPSGKKDRREVNPVERRTKSIGPGEDAVAGHLKDKVTTDAVRRLRAELKGVLAALSALTKRVETLEMALGMRPQPTTTAARGDRPDHPPGKHAAGQAKAPLEVRITIEGPSLPRWSGALSDFRQWIKKAKEDASLRSFWPKKSVVSSDIFKC